MRLRHILLALLAWSVATCWVRAAWAASAFQIAVFVCAAVWCLQAAARRLAIEIPVVLVLLSAICGWAALQLAAGWTVLPAATRDGLLYWLSALATAFLVYRSCTGSPEREAFLKALLYVGFAVSALGAVQLFTSDGRVFWLFPSGYLSEVIGPFVSANNYAAFVELLVPIALALAIKDTRRSVAWLAIAACMVASVLASGSRAGSALVVAEVAAVSLVGPARLLEGRLVRGFLVFALLGAGFAAVFGFEFLWRKLAQEDPYAVRRELLESTLAMIRARPATGFGLGAWPSVYPQFAVIDTGAVANHAHNEWAQWAAEGGLPMLALAAGVFACCLRPALRSVWGIGIPAVFVHSLVDYPFLRLGLAAWIFAMIGALAAYSRELNVVARAGDQRPPWGRLTLPARAVAIGTLPALALAAFEAGRLGWADTLYRRGAPESIQRAIALAPNRPEYHFAMAEADPDRAALHLDRAVALNRWHTKARIALAFELEAQGKQNDSEALLLEAARRDRQFAPAWALANFYFRAGRGEDFWRWAGSAAAVTSGELRPLFDLCFAESENEALVLGRVVAGRRPVERAFLAYTLEHGRLDAAHNIALRVLASPDAADRDALLAYVDLALLAGRNDQAREVWNAMCRGRMLPYRPLATASVVNGDFAVPILNRGFDWRVRIPDGVHATQAGEAGRRCLRFTFSGKQPEVCDVLSQLLSVRGGRYHTLGFEYRTAGLPDDTGLAWAVSSREQYRLRASEEWKAVVWPFQAPSDADLLVLRYRRTAGATRIEGSVALRAVRLEAEGEPATRAHR